MIRWTVIAFVVVLTSCMSADGIERFEAPENLLPRDKMVDVIREMTKLEAHIQSKYISVAKYNKVMINSGDSLLRSMNVTRDAFDASMGYYGSRQEEMKSIYQDALEGLNKELGKLESEN